MLGTPNRDRAAERRAATRDEIVAAAWELAAEHGLAGFTLRDIGERVGMRAPSLYTHFAGKHAIYDAMFGQAWADFERHASDRSAQLPDSPRALVRFIAHLFFDHAVSHPERHQLMNERVVPGFEPSPDAYAPSLRVYEQGVVLLRDVGVTDQKDFDLFTALVAGLVSAQLANNPGGRRWADLVDRAVDYWADGVGLPKE